MLKVIDHNHGRVEEQLTKEEGVYFTVIKRQGAQGIESEIRGQTTEDRRQLIQKSEYRTAEQGTAE